MIENKTPSNSTVQARADEFRGLVREHIHRDGIGNLMKYLETTDFFVAPASTRYHGAWEGGLCEHSLNVYRALNRFCSAATEPYGWEYSSETLAVVSLFHDICKTGCYGVEMRNRKDETGTWVKVPYYTFNDPLPYGHGEKSVYILSGFIRLSREEAFAIRYHMGFSNDDSKSNVGKAFEMFPLAFAMSVADMESTYFVEGKL